MGKIIKFRKRRKWTRQIDYPISKPAKKMARGWLVFVPFWAGAVLVGTAYGAGWVHGPKIITPQSAFRSFSGRFGNCYTGGGWNCVVDGDTFYMNHVKIRIADIDAPETHPSRCAEEDRLGRAATKRLQELLNSGTVTLSSIDRDEDVYGRKLRNVEVDGLDIGQALVNEGLAHWYVHGKLPWC